MSNEYGDARFDRRQLLGKSAAGIALPAALGAAGVAAVRTSASEAPNLAAVGRESCAPNNGGLSPARLDRMHDVMNGHVQRGNLPGLVTVVSRGDETRIDALGALAFDADAPMQRDTIFRIASVTKPIVAAAAMTLVEDCTLRLDEPVDRLLPELADRRVLRALESPLDDTVPANRPITLRDLLTFRLGYGLVFAAPGTFPIQTAMEKAGVLPDIYAGGTMPELAPDKLMVGYGALPLLHQPGEQFLYNSGADILGVLIARAAGMSLGDVLEERVFAPLGMKDSGFYVPTNKLDRLASSYWPNVATGALELFDGAEDSRWSAPPVFESGGGGLVSTAVDLLAFGQMMLHQGRFGNEQILSRPSITLMTTDHLTTEQKAASPFFPGSWENTGWGFGISVVTRRDTLAMTPGRYGWDGGYGTSWYVDPAEDLIGILLTQRVWDATGMPSVYSDFWTSAYQAITN